jgi:hypothetical protein
MFLVRASYLIADAWCNFEQLGQAIAPFQSGDGAVAKGVKVSSELLLCEAPSLVGTGVDELRLTLSMDGTLHTKSQSSFVLRVTDQCPAGYACLDAEIIECPPGHQCPGGSLEQPPRPC